MVVVEHVIEPEDEVFSPGAALTVTETVDELEQPALLVTFRV
jgi:hypothetical protein